LTRLEVIAWLNEGCDAEGTIDELRLANNVGTKEESLRRGSLF
jgi:hypothetical protein